MRTPPHTLKLIIFDLDGTLVDAYPAIISSFNFTMKELGLPAQGDLTIRRAVGWGDRNLLKPFVKTAQLDKASSIYRKHHMLSLKRRTKLLPGALALLKRLKRHGYRLAVASNRPTKFSHIILDTLGIRKCFDYILCGDKLRKPKPSPDILFRILRRLSAKPSQALYVGDMTIDIETGRRAGIKTVAVTTGSHTKNELIKLKPYAVVDHVLCIYNIAREMNKGI